MKIACWSGPRNISTALMRSWSSRKDTFVSDEPFYSYYLKKQGLKHPMYKEIIESYPHEYDDIIKYLLSEIPQGKKYWYQKHMAHHMDGIEDFSWIKNFKNYFLIRHPKYVISSFIKKNTLNSVKQLGYPQQLKIIEYLRKNNLEFYVISSEDILDNPQNRLANWCSQLNIPFHNDMLSWEKGPHENDGIWGKHWYDSVYQTSGFFLNKQLDENISLDEHECIYKEAYSYYKKIYTI